MATFANLVVKVNANTSGLQKSLKGATSRVSKFAKDAARIIAKLGAVIATTFTAAFAASLVAINKNAAAIDNLAKTSSKLGIAAEDLQSIQFAAQLSGVSIEKTNMALQRMTRRVSEAARGTGEAKDALKELGLDAAALNALAPDKQFREIAKAMKEVSNQSDRVRLSFKLFDSEGVALVNALTGELEENIAAFEKLGGTITTSQAKAVEAFNDAKSTFAAFTGLISKNVTAEVAPAFTKFIEQILMLVKEMGGIKAVAKEIASAVVSAASVFVQSFAEVAKVIGSVRTALADLRDITSNVFASIESGFRTVQRNIASSAQQVTGAFAENLEIINAGANPLSNAAKELSRSLGNVSTAAENRRSALDQSLNTRFQDRSNVDSSIVNAISRIESLAATLDQNNPGRLPANNLTNVPVQQAQPTGPVVIQLRTDVEQTAEQVTQTDVFRTNVQQAGEAYLNAVTRNDKE